MSRFFDRIRAEGSRPLTVADLLLHALPDLLKEATGRDARGQVEEFVRQQGADPTPDLVERVLERSRGAHTRTHADEAPLRPGELGEIPVIVADNVGRYVAELPIGTSAPDVTSTLVPPFKRMFVDVQDAPNDLRMLAWGSIVSILRDPKHRNPSRPEGAWVVGVDLFAEWARGKPVGPIAHYILPLDESGRFLPGDSGGHGRLLGGLVDISKMDAGAKEAFHQGLLRPLLSVLLAISFMHCKNVDVVPVIPPAALSKKHFRLRGVPLASYHVLNIEPMRRVLSRDGRVETSGLRHALHICRGHFKTFTEEAPLFGRHAGTYWWADYVRGDVQQGTVTKDYRITIAEAGLGREFEPLAEHLELAQAEESRGRDPDLAGRGLRAHNATVNALAEAVKEAGFAPRSPKPEEPQYDLAWDDGTAIWVAEVKSLTPRNEEKQLRLALGQVLRYRQLLDAGTRPVKAMIAVEQCPADDRWLDLCAKQDVVLVWNGMFGQALRPSEKSS